jgi:phosphatidylglycerol:prolipoprotein diacylglycerol transferase
MLSTLVWQPDPVLLPLGPITIRYYGLIFVITLLIAYAFWTWQMKRGKYSERVTSGFFAWGVLAVIGGARLGHCFFYNAGHYLANPLDIFKFWEGGLASHGATLGLAIVLVLYSKLNKLSVLDIMDRFAMSAACGAAGVRFGNFMNSEIVGRQTDVPWAVCFPLFDGPGTLIPRHPSQLYEFTLGLAVLGTLVLVDRLAGKEQRPRGLMTGTFLAMYFAGRFCVEFFKEYHRADLQGQQGLTMGQYLSLLPFLAGVLLIMLAIIRGRPRPDQLKAA